MLALFQLSDLDAWSTHLPTSLALAAVAAIGYLVGRRSHPGQANADSGFGHSETRRAKVVAHELENVAESIRKSLAKHQSSVLKFKSHVCSIGPDDNQSNWRDLCREAEQVLAPTLELATVLNRAYERIRQQSQQLMSFTEAHTDSLTGVCNRRALDETLEQLIASMHRYGHSFTIAILDIDHFKKVNDMHGHLQGDQILRQVAKSIDETARDTDIVARYGGEEFVVVMPNTNLAGASIYSERLRQMIERTMSVTVSGGVAEVLDADTPQSVLARADAAMYCAKTAGRNRIFCHDGKQPISNLTCPVKAGV